MADTDHVDNLLRSANRLELALAMVRTLALGAVALVVAFIVVLLLDAGLSLPTVGLLTLDFALAAVLALAVASIVWTVRRRRFERRRTARWLEERLGLRDNSLINAIDLAVPPHGASASLTSKAVADANDLAWKTSPTDAVPSGPALAAVGAAFGAALGVAVFFLAAPRLAAMVTARLLDPHGDHPPYTLLDFDVQIAPEKLYVGRPANVDVKISGPRLPETARLVFVESPTPDDSAQPTDEAPNAPLFRRADGDFTAELARLDAPLRFYVATPLGRSAVMHVEPAPIPTFESVQIEYEFPAYTGWPVGKAPLTTRGVEALAGTRAIVSITSNLPLQSGRLTLTPRRDDKKQADDPSATQTIELRPTAHAQTVSGEFIVERDGRFALSLIAASGAESDEQLTGSVKAIPDGPPMVTITHPSPHTIAVEGSVVDVLVEARDDLGVGRVSLARSVNGWGPTPGDLPLPSAATTKVVKTKSRFDLGALGARPGDLITYYATGYDIRPEPQFRDTASYVIEVISLDEYKEFARQQVRVEELARRYAELQKQMEQLKAEREKLVEELAQLRKKAKDEGLTDADQERLAAVEKRLSEYAEQARQLAQKAGQMADEPALYDAEEQNKPQLKRLQKALEQQAESAQRAAKSAAKANQGPNEQAAFDLDSQAFEQEEEPFTEEQGGELADAQETLEKLSQVDKMLEQSQRIQNVSEQQRDLADRMAQFRSKEELAPEERTRARQFAREQQRLQEELEDAARQLEKAAEEAQEIAPQTAAEAQQLAEAIKGQNIPGDQQASAEGSRAGKGKPAFDAAEQAAQKLEALAGSGPDPNSAGEELSQNLDPGLGLQKGRLQKSLKQMMQGRLPGPPGKGQQQGEQGEGLAGSRPKTTIVGPHMPTGRESDADQSGQGRESEGRGAGQGSDYADAGNAESLSPEARAAGAGPANAMRGVPLGYRDQVDAYFKRLAEE